MIQFDIFVIFLLVSFHSVVIRRFTAYKPDLQQPDS
uniref:Uncharacterized protein n=1 Tax=Anguilla anguilla TaxID=7936 RepID=A0A0E9R9I5_ANGAN